MSRWPRPGVALRTACVAAAALGPAGCGRAPETTRFVPAGPVPAASAEPERARPEVRKIEMH